MTSSLVGSEMCIRDSKRVCAKAGRAAYAPGLDTFGRGRSATFTEYPGNCLLYTSDAADDM
eukprot:9265292-Prorocentrum_lima.AAC.1